MSYAKRFLFRIKNTPLLLGLLAVTLWATCPSSMSELTDIPPFELMFLVFGFSFLPGLLISWKKGNFSAVLPKKRRFWVIGPLCLFFNQATYCLAFRFLEPAQAELLYYLWPLFLTGLCIAVRMIQFRPMHLVSTLLAVMGIFVCCAHDCSLHDLLGANAIGISLALASGLCWAAYSFFTKLYKKDSPPFQSLMLAAPVSGMGLISHLIFEEQFVIPSMTQMLIVAFHGLVIMGLSLCIWQKALSKGKLNILSLLPYFVPVLSIFILIGFGKACFSMPLVLSGLLVTLGCSLLAIPRGVLPVINPLSLFSRSEAEEESRKAA